VTGDALRTLLTREIPRLVPGLSAAYLFGSQARNEYFDLMPILRRYRRMEHP
jgi:predicted nucleotidyltransferase